MNNEKYLFPAAVIICISIYYIWVLKKFSCEICIITAFEIQKSHFRVILPPPSCHSSTKLSKYSPDIEVFIREYMLKSYNSAGITEKFRLKFSKKAFFRLGFDVLLLSTEFQAVPIVKWLYMQLDQTHTIRVILALAKYWKNSLLDWISRSPLGDLRLPVLKDCSLSQRCFFPNLERFHFPSCYHV